MKKVEITNPKEIRKQLGADVRGLGHWSKLAPLVLLPSTTEVGTLVAIDTRLGTLSHAFGLRLIWLENPAAKRMGMPGATYIMRCVYDNAEIRRRRSESCGMAFLTRDYNTFGLDDGLPADREMGLMSTKRGQRSVFVLPEEFKVCGAVTGFYKTIHRSGQRLLDYLQAADTAPARFAVGASTFNELRDKVTAAARVYGNIEEPADLMDRSFPKTLALPERREYRDAVRWARSKGLKPRELAAVGGGR